MRAHRITRALAAVLATAAAGAAPAQTVVTDVGVPYIASALTGFATSGSDMGGMAVTAFFTDGTSASGVWGDVGGGTWGVLTPQFGLTLGAGVDTWDGLWRLQIDPDGFGIARLVLNGSPGKTVFDIDDVGVGSAGSALGWPMTIDGGDSYNTTVKYRNVVSIGGAPFIGDLFETMDITFDVQGGARFLQFRADTDNIGVGDTMTRTPEPATYTMLAAGLGALLLAHRRRRTA